MARTRRVAALRGLRVLDLSANELARDPGADELPLASLTVLDLRGNPFGKTRVTAGPVLEELDGEAVVPRAGGGRSTVTAVGDAVRRPVARSTYSLPTSTGRFLTPEKVARQRSRA